MTPALPNAINIGDRPLIMGILNVTPDSFSDGGSFMEQEHIADQVNEMLSQGVDIIDVGGESSRPFSDAVSVTEELNRVIPAIETIRRLSPTVPISIDTTKAEVAQKAIAAGADIINDISGLRFDPQMIEVALANKVPVIIMHMQGTPGNMQVKPHYEDVIDEIMSFFKERIAWAKQKGLARERIIVDPGIGFGKTIRHNLLILKHVTEFKKLGCPVLVGHSRKAFIGNILDLEVDERDTATASISAYCSTQGVDIIRVHNVRINAQTIRMAEAINKVS
ncbi:MAG: dihydropteroate synthase [Desulfobulbaceae bacterium]|nr:dihydropteroate synthase [Desulfobulbaceae bacterium]